MRVLCDFKTGLPPIFASVRVCASFINIFSDVLNSRLLLDIIDFLWWPEVELNYRHTDFQSVALPTELSGLGGDRKVFFKHMNILDF